jgi:hypothetical protein
MCLRKKEVNVKKIAAVLEIIIIHQLKSNHVLTKSNHVTTKKCNRSKKE